MNPPLNTRQQIFVRKHGIEGKPATVAYQEAYGVDDYGVAATSASRLLKNVHVQVALEQQFKDDSQHAYNILMEMLNDPMTPAAVRKQIASEILDRGGHGAVQKSEVKETKIYEGITDVSREELIDMLVDKNGDKPKKSA